MTNIANVARQARLRRNKMAQRRSAVLLREQNSIQSAFSEGQETSKFCIDTNVHRSGYSSVAPPTEIDKFIHDRIEFPFDDTGCRGVITLNQSDALTLCEMIVDFNEEWEDSDLRNPFPIIFYPATGNEYEFTDRSPSGQIMYYMSK